MSLADLKIFSGNANSELAEKICRVSGVKLGDCTIKKFSNDNIKVKYNDHIRGADVFIVQPSSPPVSDGIIELLIMIDAAKHASASRVTAVLPYFPYVRSDKKDEPRISITARLMADLLEAAGADRVLTMNLHSPQVQGFFRIPVDQLSSGDLMIDYFKQNFDLANHVVVAPDAGSAKRAGQYAISMDLPMAILDKRRNDDTENPKIAHVIGEVKDKDALIFDDEISTAGSMAATASALKKLGVVSIKAAATHGVLCGPAVERIKSSDISELVVTDSVRISEDKCIDKITVLSIDQLFSNAIRRIHNGESVSEMFRASMNV
ncbi:MAG: ribose-phosphate diphosphokinase [Fibrobacterota bacterium]